MSEEDGQVLVAVPERDEDGHLQRGDHGVTLCLKPCVCVCACVCVCVCACMCVCVRVLSWLLLSTELCANLPQSTTPVVITVVNVISTDYDAMNFLDYVLDYACHFNMNLSMF